MLGTSAGDITATTTKISIQFEEFKAAKEAPRLVDASALASAPEENKSARRLR